MTRYIAVFVSSTSEDLPDHRAAVRKAILDLGLHPIMMENFAAEGIIAVDRCKRSISEADIYVGIYAHRYGWVPTEKQGGDGTRSITALEYDWAGERDIPRLCFLVDPEHPWGHGPKYVDKEPGKKALLDQLKARVSEETIRKEFTEPADLAQKVTIALHLALQQIDSGWRRPTAPPLLHSFVGRAEDRERIGGWLRESDPAVVVRGAGGIGKTYLAQHLARALDDAFPGGVLWASFGPEARETDSVLPPVLMAWASASPRGRSVDETRLTPDLVRGLLSDAPGRLLAILDDVWHLDSARALCKALPDGTARLITTRSRRVIPLGRDCPLDKLDPADAFTLLSNRLRTAGDDPNPVEDDLHAIARLLDGHALALDLAARQVIVNGTDFAPRFAERLARHLGGATPFKLLSFGPGETREDSLEAALFLSYDALGADAPGADQPARRNDLQAKFRALGVLAPDASFSVRTAFAIWGAATWDTDTDNSDALEDAEDTLMALVRAGLVARVPGGGRYEQHMLLHHYAGALARRTEEYDPALGRYTRHVIRDIAAQFDRLPQEQWNETILPDRDHIHHVGNMLVEYLQAIVFGETPVEALAGPEPPDSLPDVDRDDRMTAALLERSENFAVAVHKYVIDRRVGDEGRRWLMAGLACARLSGNQGGEGLFTSVLGQWHDQRGQMQTALDYHTASLVITRLRGDKLNEGATLNNMGLVYSALGQHDRALDLYEQSLAIKREVGDRAGEAPSLNNMGEAYRALSQYDRALEFYKQSLTITREVGDRDGETTTLNNMGLVYDHLAQYDRALDLYEQALPIRREVGDRAGEAATLNNMGGVYRALDQHDRALDLYEQALPITREVGNRAGEAITLNNMGGVYNSLGQHDRALEFYEQALPIRREIGDRAGEATTLNNMGGVYHALGQSERALDLHRQTLPIMCEVGDRAGEAVTCFNIGYLLHEVFGRTAEAIEYVERCVQIEEEIGLPNLDRHRAYLETLRTSLADE